MRKIFTFLCAALMSVGMFATTVVTITQDDFPKSGTSFTKDGVTVSAGNIEGTLGNLKNGGSFSTTLGNFTEIEVTANNVSSMYGPGWSGTSGKMTWRGNAASSVSFSGNIMGMGMGTTLKFTIAEPAPAIENSITINGTPQVGDNSISLTYYFDPANVPGICCNAPTLKVKCAADNKWDEIWLSLNNISSGTTTITLDELGSFQEGKSYDVCFAYNNGSWVDEVFQSFTPAVPQPAAEVTVVFAANNKTVERTVTLPHTFWCNLGTENGELDLIIQELYALPLGGYCDAWNGPVATGNPAVTAGAGDEDDDFITISEAFEGTATVSGKYNRYTEMDEEEFYYTLTISTKNGAATAISNTAVETKAIKRIVNGQLLIEKNGKIYNVMGAQVK